MLDHLRYFARLAQSLGWAPRFRGKRSVAGMLVLGAALAVVGLATTGALPATPATAGSDSMLARAVQIDQLLERAESVYDEEVAPIERVLLQYRRDEPQLIRRVAVSLVREARRTELEPRLLLALLLVENPWIDPAARSPVGARGLMQVMPLHLGNWKRCAPRLDDIDANICHGAHIFAAYLRETGGNVDRALLRYNGCVKGTNTPDCHQYPTHVYARAGRASLLAWRNGAGSPAGAR